MLLLLRPAALLLCVSLCAASWPLRAQTAEAQAKTPPPAQAADAGKEILTRKCFQCHAATMWSPLRQDRKAWEGVLYRMVGRGALWTEDEIKAMADFLARVNGPAPAAQK
jgi:cytochrome c5